MRSLVCLLAAISLAASGEVSSRLFRHHSIAQELPGKNVGMGASALADFDRDRDLDFAVYNRGDGKLYWFEQKSKTDWVRHVLGELPASQLGCATMDVDRDGWPDLVTANAGSGNASVLRNGSGTSLMQAVTALPVDPVSRAARTCSAIGTSRACNGRSG